MDARHAATGAAQERGQPVELNRWQMLGEYDEELQERWLGVMSAMNASYLNESVLSLRRWICDDHYMGSRAYYFAGSDFEVVARFHYSRAYAKFQVLSAGFVGRIEPAAALDLLIDLAIAFLSEPSTLANGHDFSPNTMLAVCPKRMDEPKLVELFGLIPSSPRLRAVVKAETPQGIKYDIKILEINMGS